MGAHAFGELDQLLLELGPLGGTQVQLREGLDQVLPAGLQGGLDLSLGVLAQDASNSLTW